MYELRPATEADREWLYELNRAALADYVVQTWGEWDEPSQRAYFADRFAPARLQVLAVDGEDAGAIEVRREPGRIFLGNIELLPRFQSRGIGSAVITDLLVEADRCGFPIELQVLKVNPARALYERLGFEVFGETETHHQMRRVSRA